MPLVCLVGRHGSGKSSIGSALAAHGYTHLSVGMLRRLAFAGKFASDVPPSLTIAMRRALAGIPLATDIALKLLKHAASFPHCVIDGFPASVEHLDLLPAHARIALVWAPKHVREQRLIARAEQSVRQWTAGRGSARDDTLAAVIRASQSKGKVLFLANRDAGQQAVAHLARRLSSAI